jgi:hypothetical protein
MTTKYKKKIILILCLITGLAVLYYFFKTIREGFDSIKQDQGTPETNHNVDLPLTTTTSCSNFCGPQSQCAKTRDQCTSDIDCPGCQPVINTQDEPFGPDVPGQNDAGKIGFYAPQYSSLTTDMGTQAAFYYPAGPLESGSKTAHVAVAQLGSGPTLAGIEGQRLFDVKNAQPQNKFEPKYPVRESATGMFLDKNGPLASNSYL